MSTAILSAPRKSLASASAWTRAAATESGQAFRDPAMADRTRTARRVTLSAGAPMRSRPTEVRRLSRACHALAFASAGRAAATGLRWVLRDLMAVDRKRPAQGNARMRGVTHFVKAEMNRTGVERAVSLPCVGGHPRVLGQRLVGSKASSFHDRLSGRVVATRRARLRTAYPHTGPSCRESFISKSTPLIPRAAAFYRAVFGWKMEKRGGPQDYWLVTTGADGDPESVAGSCAAWARRRPTCTL